MVALTLLLVTGCTHTHRNCSPQSLNEESRGKQMVISTLDGPVRGAEEVMVSADTTSWRDCLSLRRSIGNSGILGFEVRSPGMGALEGLLFGALGGGAAGWVKGYSEGDDTGDYRIFTAEDKAVMWGSVGAISSGLSGAIIGAILGSKHVYLVGASASETVK